MSKLTLICGILCYITVAWSDGDIGPGLWEVHHVKKCEEDSHKFTFNIGLKKLNRTHDGFFGSLSLTELFDEHFGFRSNICKNVDGGCKPVQVLSDVCFINFVNQYAEENVKNFLKQSGVDPPEFPIKEGDYEIKDFVFDYTELPEEAPYGSYIAQAYVLENNHEVGCVEIHASFESRSEED